MKARTHESRKRATLQAIGLLITLMSFTACQSGRSPTKLLPTNESGSDGASDVSPSPAPLATPTPSDSPVPGTPASSPTPASTATPEPTATPTPVPVPKPEVALLWEANHPERRPWSEFTVEAIETLGTSLTAGTMDVEDFCPAYFTISYDRRVNFWAHLISAMTKYESAFNPLSRYQETTMGTDPVTQQPVYSEGLLQLSYQDSRNYTFCNEFDWSTDSKLSPTDPKKSILDPYKNLRCGIQILNYQVKKKNMIAVGSGAYWSVIKTGSSYNKLAQIKALTTQIPFCKK